MLADRLDSMQIVNRQQARSLKNGKGTNMVANGFLWVWMHQNVMYVRTWDLFDLEAFNVLIACSFSVVIHALHWRTFSCAR